MKFKNIIMFLVGIALAALGTYINSRTNLGNSAVGSLPFTISFISNIKLGTITYIIYSLIVLIEVIIAKKITLSMIIQIPVSVLFGFIINFFAGLLNLEFSNFYVSLLFSIIANTLIAIGMTSMIKSNLSSTPIEGLVSEMSKRFKIELGTCKNIVDVIFLLSSLVIGLIFKGKIIGIGLGTIIAVIYIGRCVSVINKIYKKFGM